MAATGNYVSVPLPDEYLKERAEWVENFLDLQQEGIDKGFLDEQACVECPGAIVPDTRTSTWVEA